MVNSRKFKAFTRWPRKRRSTTSISVVGHLEMKEMSQSLLVTLLTIERHCCPDKTAKVNN